MNFLSMFCCCKKKSPVNVAGAGSGSVSKSTPPAVNTVILNSIDDAIKLLNEELAGTGIVINKERISAGDIRALDRTGEILKHLDRTRYDNFEDAWAMLNDHINKSKQSRMKP